MKQECATITKWRAMRASVRALVGSMFGVVDVMSIMLIWRQIRHDQGEMPIWSGYDGENSAIFSFMSLFCTRTVQLVKA